MHTPAILTRIALASAALALSLAGWAAAQYTPEPTPAQLSELRQMMMCPETVNAASAAGYVQSSECMSSAQGRRGSTMRVRP